LQSRTSVEAYGLPFEAPTTVYTRREADEDYDGLVSRDGDLRIIKSRDDIQWIVQQFSGGRWRSKSYHRTRHSLIQRYGALEMILALPEHHDGFVELTPRCEVCGRIKSKPAAAWLSARRQRETAPVSVWRGRFPITVYVAEKGRRLVRRASSSFDLNPCGDIDAHD
jgi:hypothetical protein